MAGKITCDDNFCRSFIEDCQKCCKENGIKMEDINPELIKKCQKGDCTIDECRSMLAKSRCCGIFDFCAS